jgi:hypothetical protein
MKHDVYDVKWWWWVGGRGVELGDALPAARMMRVCRASLISAARGSAMQRNTEAGHSVCRYIHKHWTIVFQREASMAQID